MEIPNTKENPTEFIYFGSVLEILNQIQTGNTTTEKAIKTIKEFYE